MPGNEVGPRMRTAAAPAAWLRTLACGLLVLLLLLPAAAQRRDAAPEFDAEAEAALLRLINQERRAAGLGELAMDERLREAARRHTGEMAAQRRLTHQLPGGPDLRQRLAQTTARVDAIAENVALNTDVEGAHADLMLSEGHRRNIMNPLYNAVGLGAQWQRNVVYVTQVFARRLPELTSEEAEERIAAGFNQAREQIQRRALRWVASARLRQMACEMAQRDKLDTSVLRTDRGMRSVVAYTVSEPDRLPEQARSLVGEPFLEAFAVGACYSRSPQYPTGMHWVILALYD